MLGNRIKHWRIERGMTQEALGIASDVGNSNVRSYENGRALPSLFTLIRIASALDISAGELILDLEPGMFPEHKNRGQRLKRDASLASGQTVQQSVRPRTPSRS